jgi:hypothetical protein
MTVTAGTGRRHWPLWIAGAVGAVAYAVVFYPGAMSFDSAYLWWQARGGESTNVYGVGMTWLWRVGNAVMPGPGALFVLQLLLFWSGLVLIAQRLSAPMPWRLVFMLVAAAAPVCFVLLSHVWSDTMLMAVLTCAIGIALRSREGCRLCLWPVWALLLLAMTLRHNAAAAVFPLLIYTVHLRNANVDRGAGTFLRTASIALLVALLFQGASFLLDRTVDKRRATFAAIQLWDLAAVSLDVGTILLPPASHGAGLTLDDLRRAFVPYTNTILFEKTQAGMLGPHFFSPDDPLNDEIRRAWFGAIVAHPASYLEHRWRLTRALFGSKSHDWPRGLVYFDGEHQYDGNPPVTPNSSRAHAWFVGLFEAMRDSVLLSAWPYLCLAVVALAAAVVRRHRADMWPALAVPTSGLLYAAPLPFIAPAAELRYTGWTCLAALIGTALVLAAPRDSNAGHDTPQRVSR